MRIRSIKPEFWTSEDVADIKDWSERLLFLGLWQYVDDNGVGRDVPKLIVAELFPLEDDPRDTLARVSRGLQTLSVLGRITRYEVNGKPFLHVTNWHHQRIDKPNKPRYPLPTSEDAVIRETLARVSRDIPETPAPVTEEQGNRGTEEQGIEETCSPAAPSSAFVYPADFEEFWTEYPLKAGKRKALTAWKAALKRSPAAEIREGAIRYAQDPNRSDGFTKHAEGWLNGDRWLDDPIPVRGLPAISQGPTRQDAKVLGYLETGQRLADAYVNDRRAIGS